MTSLFLLTCLSNCAAFCIGCIGYFVAHYLHAKARRISRRVARIHNPSLACVADVESGGLAAQVFQSGEVRGVGACALDVETGNRPLRVFQSEEPHNTGTDASGSVPIMESRCKASKRAHVDTEAVAYMRTSSSFNVGDDKDSETRQWEAISAFAEKNGFSVRDTAKFYDAAVSGGNELESRPQLKALQEYCKKHGVTTIIMEDSSRFARDLLIQERGYQLLTEQGFKLIAAKHPEQFTNSGPTATLMRQILGAVNEFDKHMVVSRLKSGRDKKIAAATCRTLSGKGKAGGARSRLDGPDGTAIREMLTPFAKKRKLTQGDPLKASKRLASVGVCTATGKEIPKKQVRTYINAIKGELKRAQSGSANA